MKNEVFVLSDPHGCHNRLDQLLQHWNPDNQQLLILGDLVDRGDDSLGVILRAKELKEQYGAQVVGGNHDEWFVDFLRNPNEDPESYFNMGGRETIKSFFDGQDYASKFLPDTVAKLIKEQFPEEVRFLTSLPDYIEIDDYVFVHAGVNLHLGDWKNTTHNQFRWIREAFHYAPNNTGKIFVFGHTPTSYLNADQSCGIWVSPCQTKIGIDGGAVFGGLLLGLVIKEEAYEVYAA